MATPRWDAVIFVLLTVAVSIVVVYKVYDSGIFGGGHVESSPIEKELEWASAIEGTRIDEYVTIDRTSTLKNREGDANRRGRFVIIIGDSLCKPCFGNLVKEFVIGLKENNCPFDPSRWTGVFVGENSALGKATFKGVFGEKAEYVTKASMKRTVVAGNDGLVAFVTNDNTVLAASKIARVSPSMRNFFIKRAANALRSDTTKG